MKYTTTIEVNCPLEEAVEKFQNPDTLKDWMEGFQSMDLIEGRAGQTGAKSNMYFKMGKREIHMLETIVANNLPDEFHTTYEAKGVYNVVKTRFKKLDDEITQVQTEHEFRFKGFMRIMAFLMPSAFKKQSKKILEDFKKFVESN